MTEPEKLPRKKLEQITEAAESFSENANEPERLILSEIALLLLSHIAALEEEIADQNDQIISYEDELMELKND